MTIKPINKSIREKITELLIKEWGSEIVVSRGKIYKINSLDGMFAEKNNELIGIITYRIYKTQYNINECEIVSLNSFKSGLGIGTLLIEEVKKIPIQNNCKRLWLITTNDNINAIKFYQKKGFHISDIYINAIENSRKLKSEIPILGNDNIPIRDEIEFEIILKE